MSNRPGPIRILHIASGDLWAGAEAQVASLLTHLARDESLAIRAVLLNPGELGRRLEAAGIQVSVLDEARLNSLRILGELRCLVREFQPHVIHTHRTKENVLGGLAARLEGRRASLRTVHGAPEHRPSVWRLDKWAYQSLDEWAARHWQQVAVAVSGDLRDVLGSALPGVRTETIHNGIDERSFQSLRSYHASRHRDTTDRVAFVGRLVPVKRVDIFLEMAAKLVAAGGREWQFEIIGDGPLRAELEARAAGVGLGSRVRFHGFRQDALELLADCDVLVFTSDHEGTPMAALEALAIGVPIVARAVGGLVELLDGVPGSRLVSAAGGISPLAEAVEWAMEGELPLSTGLPDRYRIDASADAYTRLYRELAVLS